MIESPGRNELIARYIKIRTGKTRTRKQVSSHIQDQTSKEAAIQSMSSMSSAQIVSFFCAQDASKDKAHLLSSAQLLSASALQSKAGFIPPVSYHGSPFWQSNLSQPTLTEDVKPFGQGPGPQGYPLAPKPDCRPIGSPALRLVEFSAFLEQPQDTYQRHLFVHISGLPCYSDPLLETVDIRQIYDKFPDKKGGLKELFDKGPQNAFFLVKFWVLLP
ncbi:TEAD4 [Cordylochernes scorpioides]|uniref:TEAD4 n=1 Tax=Cordylochernes scorpioides TaxID=51811 RepID=A0ABY6L6N2_9ARAC|nr:TEAD4 [Cordylochernes scorpioides]